ncbi:hypothetical protein K1719_007446 [Acacia pycnantha]|nr:hypothetical protein K1719_007446 [Acacia pycnantha]
MPKRRNDELALEDDDIEDDDKMLPPHEIVARGSGVSPKTTSSVLEGVGRTLKGRDLRQASGSVLFSRIRVAIHRINSISKRIEELQDKELQPQLEELIQGLSRMWEAMFQCHKLQFQIMSTTYSNSRPRIATQSESCASLFSILVVQVFNTKWHHIRDPLEFSVINEYNSQDSLNKIEYQKIVLEKSWRQGMPETLFWLYSSYAKVCEYADKVNTAPTIPIRRAIMFWLISFTERRNKSETLVFSFCSDLLLSLDAGRSLFCLVLMVKGPILEFRSGFVAKVNSLVHYQRAGHANI